MGFEELSRFANDMMNRINLISQQITCGTTVYGQGAGIFGTQNTNSFSNITIDFSGKSQYSVGYPPANFSTYSQNHFQNIPFGNLGQYGNRWTLENVFSTTQPPFFNGSALTVPTQTAVSESVPILTKSQPKSKPSQTQTTPKTQAATTAHTTAKTKTTPSKQNANDVTGTGNGVQISPRVYKRIEEIAKNINCSPKDLLGVIFAESGFGTTSRNKKSNAIGLIQFTSICIRDLNDVYGLNLTKEKIAGMGIFEQLDLAEKSLKRAKEIAGFKPGERLSAGDLYALNYLPGRAKRTELVSASSRNYNRGLDINGDGVITKDELGARVRKFSNQVGVQNHDVLA